MNFRLDSFALATEHATLTGADLLADCFCLRNLVSPGDICVLESPSASLVAAALVILDGWAAEVHLAPSGVSPAITQRHVIVANVTESVGRPLDRSTPLTTDPPISTEWVLYTSGTTGIPKSVRHNLATLTKSHHASTRSSSQIWGLIYEPTRMAGIQVITAALVSGNTVVAPAISGSLKDKVEAMRVGHVTSLSATPTLWRQILQSDLGSGWPLTQVTLGGEIADQKILSALGTVFSEARISHVYASTEAGVAFTVHDGVEGFPLAYLDQSHGGVVLKITDGELEVADKSRDREMPFHSTGDCVEIRDGRAMFVGRSSGMVNVGGSKVWPEDVEARLRDHELVNEAFVWARSNPFSGSILLANVTTIIEAGPNFPQELRKWIRAMGPSYAVPASIYVVESIETSPAGKVTRR